MVRHYSRSVSMNRFGNTTNLIRQYLMIPSDGEGPLSISEILTILSSSVSEGDLIYKIMGLLILLALFALFIYMAVKIQSYQVKVAKQEMDLQDEIIKSKINSEPLADLVDDNNKSRNESGH